MKVDFQQDYRGGDMPKDKKEEAIKKKPLTGSTKVRKRPEKIEEVKNGK